VAFAVGSELAKLSTILYLAWFLSLDQNRRNKAGMEFAGKIFLADYFLPAAGPFPGLRPLFAAT